jgi:hypothetical protein
MTLAGKQGRCAGCRRVLEVPATGPSSSGRTPDPDEGLLEVLDARRASERLPTKKPSERVAQKKLSTRLENIDVEVKRPSDRVGAAKRSDRVDAAKGPKTPEPAPLPLLEGADAAGDDEGATTSLHVVPSPPGPLPFGTWARRVPLKVWFGVFLSLPLPALGVALCVLGLRQATERKAGERMAWTGIVIGGSIMLMNLVVVAMRALSRA